MQKKVITWPAEGSFARASITVDNVSSTLYSTPFRKLKNDTTTNLTNLTFDIEYNDDVIYVDLNDMHDSDSKFSISVKMTFPAIDWTKARNFLTFGTHVAGTNSREITIGTDPTNPMENNIPVIGLIGKNPEDTIKSTLKSGINQTDHGLNGGTEYTFRITYNPLSINTEKLLLFIKKNQDDFILYSSLEGLNLNLYNLTIINKRMLIGTSGWTNEPSWNNKMDFCPLTLIKVDFSTNSIEYPPRYIEDTYTITESDFTVVNTLVYDPLYPYLSDAAESKLFYKFKTEYVTTTVDVILRDTTGINNISLSYEGIEDGFYVCSANRFPSNFISLSNVEIKFDYDYNLFVDGSNIQSSKKNFIVDNIAPTDVKVQVVTANNGVFKVRFDSVSDAFITDVVPSASSSHVYSSNTYYNETFVTSDGATNATFPQYGINTPYVLHVFGLTDAHFREYTDIQDFEINRAPTSFRSNQGNIDTVLNELSITGLSYTEDIRAFAYVVDHMNNKSDYFPIFDSNNSDIFFIGDIFPPHISITEIELLNNEEFGYPYLKIDGIAYDEQTNYNVYAMMSTSNYHIDDVNLRMAFDDHIDRNVVITNGSELNSNDGAFSNIVMEKEWNGTNLVYFSVDTDYYLYMVIKDSGARSTNIYTKYSDSGIIFRQQVNSLAVLSSNRLVFTSRKEQIAITGDTVTIRWSTLLKENDSSTIKVELIEPLPSTDAFFSSDTFRFSDGNQTDSHGNYFTVNADLTEFTYTYNVTPSTPKGKLRVKLRKNSSLFYLPNTDDIDDTSVFIQQDLSLGNTWMVSANPDDNILYKHNTLQVTGSGGNSFIKTVLNSLDFNFDIKFGYPFDLSIYSMEDHTNVVTYNNITYNSNSSTFNNFPDYTVLYSNIEESTAYTIVVSATTELGFTDFKYHSGSVNTGFDYPKITYGVFNISAAGNMTISANDIKVIDNSSAVDLYYSIFTSNFSKDDFEDELKDFYMLHNRGIRLTDTPVPKNTLSAALSISEAHDFYTSLSDIGPIPMNPDFSTYYVNLFAIDARSNTAVVNVPKTFLLNNFGTPSIVTEPAGWTVSSNQTIHFNWTTAYNSSSNDFHATVMGLRFEAESNGDSRTWTLSNVVVPSDWSSSNAFVEYDITYSGDSNLISFVDKVFIDTTEPEMLLNISNIFTESNMSLNPNEIKFKNLQFVSNSESNIITEDYQGYIFEFFAINNSNPNSRHTKRIYDNFPIEPIITHLDGSTFYQMGVKITDAAGNVYETPEGDRFLLQTLDAISITTNITKQEIYSEGIHLGYKLEGQLYDNIENDVFMFLSSSNNYTIENMEAAKSNSLSITNLAERDNVVYSMSNVTSNVGGSFSNIVLTKYYDGTSSFDQIITGNQYYLNYYLIDSETQTVKQTNFSSVLNPIGQIISFTSFMSSNVHDSTLAYYDETLTLKFSTQYAEMIDRLSVTIGGENATVTSDDVLSNQNWTVSRSISPAEEEGFKGFEVTMDGTLFQNNSHQRITIQNQLYLQEPINDTALQTTLVLKGDVGGSSQFLNTVIMNSNNIIRTGKRKFDVTLHLRGELDHVDDVFLENIFYDSDNLYKYSDGTTIANDFTFSNLVEGGFYTPSLTISMSNNFLTSNITISSPSTLSTSLPSIDMTLENIHVNHDNILSVEVGGVEFNDLHTNYTTHLFVHETLFVNRDAVKTFIDTSVNYPVDNADFIASNLPFNVATTPTASLEHYYDRNNIRQLITGRLPTYYVYAYVEDDVGQFTYADVRRTISTFNLIEDVTLTTSTGRDYVKTGDIVYLNWKTKYRVESTDLVEKVTLMNTSQLSPTLTGDLWTVSNVVQNTYMDGIASFEIELFGTSYSNLNQFPYTGSLSTRVVDDVTIDNTPPVFTFNYDFDSVSSSNIAFSFPTFTLPEQLTFGDMDLQITMVQTLNTTQSNIETFTMTRNMDPLSTLFNITGLQDNTQYNVSATITDYAKNISAVTTINGDTVWTDTSIPLFVGGNAINSHLGSHRFSVSNIAVYDSYHECSLYVCAMEHEFTDKYITGVDVLNSNELYQFMTSNEPSFQNNAIQTLIDITDNRDNVVSQLLNVYLFTHAINAHGVVVRIKESTEYDIFYFATIEHGGDDNDVSFGNILNVTTLPFTKTMKPYELSDLISSFGNETGGPEIEYESTEGFFGSSSNITLETTPTLQHSIFNGTSYILYQNEHLPVNQTFTDFTYMIDFTFTSLSANSSENMIFFQDTNHKLLYDKLNENFKLTWGNGGEISIPLSITEGISTQIGLSIGVGKILLSVNGNVYTQAYSAIASSHMDFLVGNISVGEASRGLDGTLNYVFFWTRRFLTGKEICSAFLSHYRVLEYTFDTFSSYAGSNVYTNERYVDLPLRTQNIVNIETEYPRTGSKSIILSDPTGFLYNDDITSAKLNGNDMTVMFWYMTPNSSIPTGIMELSTERNETVLIKITNDNNKTRMVINLTNEMGMGHTMVSQKITLDNNKWYHLSFVLTDTSVLFYLNGIYKGSSLEPMTGLHTNFEDVTFFKELKLGGLNTLINTKIDHLIMYNKALTRQKILLNYEAVFENQMLLRYNFEILKASEKTLIIDESINTNHGILIGIDDTTYAITADTPMNTKAIKLDGSTQYIDIDHNIMLDKTNLQNSTFSAWVKLDSNIQGYQPIVHKHNEYRLGIDYTDFTEGVTTLQIGDGNNFYSTPASREIVSYSNLEVGLNEIFNPITNDDIYRISYDLLDGSMSSDNGTYSTPPPTSTYGIVPSSGTVDSNALSFNGLNNYFDLGSNLISHEGDLDEITFSAWVKISSDDMFMDNVIISRSDSFMFGIKGGDLYLKGKYTPSLINSPVNIQTFIKHLDSDGVKLLLTSDLFVGHATIPFESTYSIVATTSFLSKSELITLIDDGLNKFTGGEILTEPTIASQTPSQIIDISLTKIIDTSSNLYATYAIIEDASKVNNVYVYLYAKTTDINNLMDDVYRFNVNTSVDNRSLDNNPYVTVFSVSDPTIDSLTITTPTVFSSKSNIIKVFAFTFVTSGGSSFVDIDALNAMTIKTFVDNKLNTISSDGMHTGSLFGAPNLDNLVYADGFSSSEVGIQYQLQTLPDLTFKRAYNTLEPVDINSTTLISNADNTFIFTPIVVAIDGNRNYGIYINKGKWVLLNRDTVKGLLDHENSPQNTGDRILESGVESFSRLKELHDGTGLMTDLLVKTPYKGIRSYLFKWVPSQSVNLDEDYNHFNPDGTGQYFQWTQFIKPTINTSRSIDIITQNRKNYGTLCPFINEDNFAGLYKTTGLPTNRPNEYRYLSAVYPKNHENSTIFLSINPDRSNPLPDKINWFNSSNPIEVKHTELYIWMGPKQSSHFT